MVLLCLLTTKTIWPWIEESWSLFVILLSQSWWSDVLVKRCVSGTSESKMLKMPQVKYLYFTHSCVKWLIMSLVWGYMLRWQHFRQVSHELNLKHVFFGLESNSSPSVTFMVQSSLTIHFPCSFYTAPLQQWRHCCIIRFCQSRFLLAESMAVHYCISQDRAH